MKLNILYQGGKKLFTFNFLWRHLMSVYMQYKDGHIKVERFGEN